MLFPIPEGYLNVFRYVSTTNKKFFDSLPGGESKALRNYIVVNAASVFVCMCVSVPQYFSYWTNFAIGVCKDWSFFRTFIFFILYEL